MSLLRYAGMSRIFTIFRKELRDTLRDRRTLIMMIVLPLVLVPLLMVGMAALQVSQHQKEQERRLVVGLVEHGEAPGFRDVLQERPDVLVVDGVEEDSARSLIRSDSLDGVFVIGSGFGDQLQQLASAQMTLYFETEGEGVTRRRLENIVETYRTRLLDERLADMDLPSSFVETIALREVDVATSQEIIGRMVGGFLPYIFLIFCYLGAMYPAIDLAAGEKERATLETLLTTPASRMEILVGKFAVVVLAGLASAVIAMVGLIVGLQRAPELPPEFVETIQSILSVRSIALELSLLIPLTIFFAAVLLTLSMFAKSFKEAQSIVSPMSFVVIVPAAIGMLPGIELTAVTALVPVLNVSLATKEIVAGTIAFGHLALVYASLIVYAAVALYLCTYYFRNESVIFRT